MKLYFFPVAPNPTKVRLYLAEKRARGCEIKIEEIAVNLPGGEHKKPEHLARNPFGQVPVLELDDGRFLFESLPIIDYLEELHPEPSIWGGDPGARAMARQIERVADLGVLLGVGGVVHATDSPVGYKADPVVAQYHRDRVAPKLAYLDQILEDGRRFMTGDSPSVADCTLASALQFGRFREMDFSEGHTRIQKWQADYHLRPEVASIFVF